jgi:hypothetical protein
MGMPRKDVSPDATANAARALIQQLLLVEDVENEAAGGITLLDPAFMTGNDEKEDTGYSSVQLACFTLVFEQVS